LSKTAILIADEPPLRRITLHRPERRNAMTPEMQMELIAAFEDTAASNCRAMVLTGAGEAFCAGLDLAALQQRDSESGPETGLETGLEKRSDAERVARLFLALHELPMPTIAVVNGPAVGGGAGLAAVCDFTLATPAARFGFTEVRIGFVPAVVSAFLASRIGEKRSRDLLLTGRILEADEAQRIGLINEVVPAEELAQRVRALIGQLIANSPQAIRATKQLLAAQHKLRLDAAMVLAIEASVQARGTADFREGVAAFLEKRKPSWAK